MFDQEEWGECVEYSGGFVLVIGIIRIVSFEFCSVCDSAVDEKITIRF